MASQTQLFPDFYREHISSVWADYDGDLDMDVAWLTAEFGTQGLYVNNVKQRCTDACAGRVRIYHLITTLRPTSTPSR